MNSNVNVLKGIDLVQDKFMKKTDSMDSYWMSFYYIHSDSGQQQHAAKKSWLPFTGDSILNGCDDENLLLTSAENNETLTFVSLELCFLGLVNRHNELFFSYLWSFVHEFTGSSTNPIAS